MAELLFLSVYQFVILTLKVPVMTAADDSLEYFSRCFSKKIRLDISCESSARQRTHIKHPALFSLKDKSKKIKVLSAAILLGSIWVKGSKKGIGRVTSPVSTPIYHLNP